MGQLSDSKHFQRVAPGLLAVTALRVQLLADVDPENGGCRLWSDDIGRFQNRIAYEYLTGLVDAIVDNLQEAAFHELEAKQTAFAQDQELPHASPANAHRLQQRSTQDSAHVAGFFRAVGSVMDCLAGIVSGIAGLPADLRRSDVGRVLRQPNVPSAGQPLVDSLRRSLDLPPGWYEWMNEYRNQFVHRARTMTVLLPSPQGLIRRPLAHEPRLSNIEMLSRTGQWQSFLDEDRSVTLSGVLDSALGAVGSVSAEAVYLWALRRQNRAIRQPPTMWAEAPNARGNLQFAGYAPDPQPVTATAITMNPDLAERLAVGCVTDDRLPEWRGRPNSPSSE